MPFAHQFVLGFLFEGPAVAAATILGAAAVPILIHLFNRRRYRIVSWAAMRFLLAAQHQSVRRIRLQQVILLAIRASIIVCLALAMCSVMPWAEELIWRHWELQSQAAGMMSNRRTHRILVIDGSFSMATKIGDKSCFDRARAAARRVLQEAAAGDGFSLLLMASPPRRVVPQPSDDSQRVAEEVETLRLPHGNADLVATLAAVEDTLRQSPEKYEERIVYFFSDLGRSSWHARPAVDALAALLKIQAKARMILVDTGQDGVANVAVTHLGLGDSLAAAGTVTPIMAEIHNYGPEARAGLRIELLAGKGQVAPSDPPFALRAVQEQTIDLPAGQTTTVTFAHKFAAPGDYAVQVHLENDALELDDTRTMVVSVKDAVPVLLVNGKPAAELYDRATEWLKDALNPFPAGAAPRYVAARPRVISDSQFADDGLSDLSAIDCVFLCDVARLTGPEIRRLETHLRRGGGVVFFLGPDVDLDAYNRLLYREGEGLLPARLVGRRRAPNDGYFSLQADDQALRQAPLDAFGLDSDRLSLFKSRFHQHMRVALPARGRGRTILSFAPVSGAGAAGPGRVESSKQAQRPAELAVNDLALVAAPRGRGRVVLFTSTANMDWSSWPASPSYPALMQELLRFAVAGRLREQFMEVGEPLEEFFPAGTASFQATVHTPDGRAEATQTQDRDEAGILRWTDTDVSGIYRLSIGQDPRDHLFAVNVPCATEAQQSCESDLARSNREELQSLYPGWEFDLVNDLSRVANTGAPASAALRGQPAPSVGTNVARELLLAALVLLVADVLVAWLFGRRSVAGRSAMPQQPIRAWLLVLLAAGVWAILLTIAALVLHAARTGDFLGILPDTVRRSVEAHWQVPPPTAGEGTRWRLEGLPCFKDAASDPWLAALTFVLAGTLIAVLYFKERSTAGAIPRTALAGLRLGLLLLTLGVLLPQLRLLFERESWPDVAIVIDDSRSMSTLDHYEDPMIRQAVERLAGRNPASPSDRMQLAKNLLTSGAPDWLEKLLTRHQVKLHVFRASGQAVGIAEVINSAETAQYAAARNVIRDLRAEGESSRLGEAVRKVVNEFRGGSLAAIIMLTDGVTTDGENLTQASSHAAQFGVPLFFIGLGDFQEARELRLHDLQVEDSVFVNDRIVFEARLTGVGFPDLTLPVTLREKNNVAVLATQMVKIDAQGRPVRIRLAHRPTTPGEKTYVLEVPAQAGQSNLAELNRLERTVFVREAKTIKVLFIEGYARYEYRFIKSLLERESAADPRNKTMNLKVLLLDADDDYPKIDRSAVAELPTKSEMNQFDAIIVGDVDPADRKLNERWGDVADFVRERGGGLLWIAGPRHGPSAFKDTPLAAVLPIESVGREQPEDSADNAFHLEPTLGGRLHPILRFSADEAENASICGRLPPMFWCWREGRPKPGAEVLAIAPDAKPAQPDESPAGVAPNPLMVQQFVGAGRALFYGFDETWRWRFRENELRFNQFWIQTVRYLARSHSARVELRLDRQTPYRRGDPIRVMVRFPEDAPLPDSTTEVKVLMERRSDSAAGEPEIESRSLALAKLEGSRGTYESLLARTPEGRYAFRLASPAVPGERPSAQCRVLPPPGEMDRLQMNRTDMERAAEITHGKFYTLANAEDLLADLPPGRRVILDAAQPPHLLWNHSAVFLFALFLVGAEWFLRKRIHLL